jgi:hypothetical protein
VIAVITAAGIHATSADMERKRAKPSECEAGRRAAKLTEARQQARAKRANLAT